MLKKKTCFILYNLEAGGIQTYLLRFFKYLGSTENISVIVRDSRKKDLFEAYRASGVTIKFLPLGYFNPINSYRNYHYFKEQNFRNICDFNANFAGLSLLLASQANLPRRIAFYMQASDHFNPDVFRNMVNAFMKRLVFKHATHILSNSTAGLDFFFPNRKEDDNRFQVIYNAVEATAYQLQETKEEIRKDLGMPLDSFIIGHVGRVDKAKNHPVILEVFRRVLSLRPESFLVLCGRDTKNLEAQLQPMGIQDNVLLLGFREDVPRILKSLDCFFFPSITEGQPGALIEAMLSGLPIVASDIPGIRECVPEFNRKYLKSPKDIEGLSEELRKCTKPDRQAPSFKEVYSKFAPQINFTKLKDILNE